MAIGRVAQSIIRQRNVLQFGIDCETFPWVKSMSEATIRKQLQQQIEELPDEVVEQIADFTHFVIARRRLNPDYADWDNEQWQQLALAAFFRDEDSADEVVYSLDDAVEIFHP